MTTLIITRHMGSVPVIRELMKLDSDVEVVTHLPSIESIPERVKTVVGILPLHMVKQLTERKIKFVQFIVDIPPELRGQELDEETIRTLSPRVEEMFVFSLDQLLDRVWKLLDKVGGMFQHEAPFPDDILDDFPF